MSVAETDEDDNDSLDDVFEEMSHERLHGVCSRQLPRYSYNDNRSEVNDTDEDEDEDSNDIESTSYDSESDRKEDKVFAKKSDQKRRPNTETYNLPRRIMVTKKPDSMGELQERCAYVALL
jgi:hypothetical protein